MGTEATISSDIATEQIALVTKLVTGIQPDFVEVLGQTVCSLPSSMVNIHMMPGKDNAIEKYRIHRRTRRGAACSPPPQYLGIQANLGNI